MIPLVSYPFGLEREKQPNIIPEKDRETNTKTMRSRVISGSLRCWQESWLKKKEKKVSLSRRIFAVLWRLQNYFSRQGITMERERKFHLIWQRSLRKVREGVKDTYEGITPSFDLFLSSWYAPRERKNEGGEQGSSWTLSFFRGFSFFFPLFSCWLSMQTSLPNIPSVLLTFRHKTHPSLALHLQILVNINWDRDEG